jgi:hypothetical protein
MIKSHLLYRLSYRGGNNRLLPISIGQSRKKIVGSPGMPFKSAGFDFEIQTVLHFPGC